MAVAPVTFDGKKERGSCIYDLAGIGEQMFNMSVADISLEKCTAYYRGDLFYREGGGAQANAAITFSFPLPVPLSALL